jgi:hypothetical protein
LSANLRIRFSGRSYKSTQRLPRNKSFQGKIKGFRLRPKNTLDYGKSTKNIEKYKVNVQLSSQCDRIRSVRDKILIKSAYFYINFPY